MWKGKQGDELSFSKEGFKAFCQRQELHSVPDNEEGSHSSVTVECLAIDVSAIPTQFSQADLLPGSSTLSQMSAEQRDDPLISRVIDIVSKETSRSSTHASSV